jgi:hypothetical protein
MNIKNLILTTCIGIFFIPFLTAHADTAKDLETIAKAIGFINNGPSGNIQMDILYNPDNEESVSHADEVLALTADGIGGKITLTGRKLSSPSDSTSKIIFITRGTDNLYGAALNTAAANGGLTVSTDENCLGTGCVLVVKTNPNIDILVSTAAASKTGTTFSSVFSMMITKR